MYKKTIWLMGILITLCAVWISCENGMPEKYLVKGGDMAYYIDDSLGYGFDGPTNDDDTSSVWFQTREYMWKRSLASDCQEVGSYIFVNNSTNEICLGTIAYGSSNSGSLVPGSSDPRKNGLTDQWSAVAYVHTHPASDCIGDGRRRGVGPSDADQEWADKHGMPVYTIDYEGTYDGLFNDSFVNGQTDRNSPFLWYFTYPSKI